MIVFIHPPFGIGLVFTVQVAGGAEVFALTGVGGWSASETEEVCQRVNDMALATLMEAMDQIEAAVVALEERNM